MQLLILGGTIFLGRHLVEAALTRGHHVTLFNRGRHHPDIFPEVEKLRGDRDGDLTALEGRRWDAVIDTSGYLPRVVRASAELLSSNVDHYTFVSSISVYNDFSQPGITETAPVGALEDPAIEQVTGETYGPLKALCEQAVEDVLPGRVLTIRPGLIVGPHDPTDRFTYWPRRIARGGEVLAPGEPHALTQFIDVRDLAAWIVRLVEAEAAGTYNATGPAAPLTMEQLFHTCRATLNNNAWFEWVGEEFLLDSGVQPWTELPLWIPLGDGKSAGFNTVDCSKAIESGLTFRPLSETILRTYAWDTEVTTNQQPSAESRTTRPTTTLRPEREHELLTAWHHAAGHQGDQYPITPEQ